MALSHQELREAAGRYTRTSLRKSLSEAKMFSSQTAFLCHSHKDSALVEGLLVRLAEAGWDVYVDWKDHTMPDVPDKTTASNIKAKITGLEWFLFLATPNATASRWCPWEIGVADGKKDNDRILIIPTKDDAGRHFGNEYLQLYHQITQADTGQLVSVAPGSRQGTILSHLR